MINLKRLAALVAAGAMAFSLTACDGAAGDLLGGATDILGGGEESSSTEEGGEESGGSLADAVPAGQTFFQNSEKGAGSKGKVLVTHFGSHPGGDSRMYVVEGGEAMMVNGPDGAPFNAKTETLGGNAYVPVFVTGETLQSIRFDHRTKPGECNQYVATKDGSEYNAELDGTVACSR